MLLAMVLPKLPDSAIENFTPIGGTGTYPRNTSYLLTYIISSKTWDEFARKWNKPVHEFLLRHVYLETINTYKMSKLNATFATFLVSSLAHEFFMSYVLRLLRPWLFVLQMCQLPLIFVSRHPALKNHRFGNHFFWFGLCLGVPLLSILYGREYWMVRQAHSGQLF